MHKLMLLIITLFAGLFANTAAYAQQHNHHLTIVYDINISKNKKAGGIEETYNGGTKAVFINSKKARIRLVSLMRMESIFFEYDTTSLKQATVVKESGQKKYRFNLSPDQWANYNKKYDAVTCRLENDSLQVIGYNCKKAVVSLTSGEEIVAYYTDSIKNINTVIEPAFNCIPGLVLQYEYTSNRGVVMFKASKVSSDIIAKDIFIIPSAGVQTRKYNIDTEED
jgi:GLPGLI family protein